MARANYKSHGNEIMWSIFRHEHSRHHFKDVQIFQIVKFCSVFWQKANKEPKSRSCRRQSLLIACGPRFKLKVNWQLVNVPPGMRPRRSWLPSFTPIARLAVLEMAGTWAVAGGARLAGRAGAKALELLGFAVALEDEAVFSSTKLASMCDILRNCWNVGRSQYGLCSPQFCGQWLLQYVDPPQKKNSIQW